jgi:hypothetical protein
MAPFGRPRRRGVAPAFRPLGGEGRLERGEAVKLRRDDGTMRFVDDEHARRAIGEHEGEFRPGQPEIERHENRPEPRGGEHRKQEHRLIVAEKGDALTPGDAKRRKPGRDVLNLVRHLAVGPQPALEQQRLALGRARGALGEPTSETDVRRHALLPLPQSPICRLARSFMISSVPAPMALTFTSR